MEVSIIIVNYNGKELTNSLINSIKKSRFKSYEIIVLDNNSSDDSEEFIKKNHKDVKFVTNKANMGYSGINNAVEHCKGKYILFLNNDMRLEKECVDRMVKLLKSDTNVAMVAPKLVNFYDKNLKSGGTWVSRAFYNGHIKGGGNDRAKEIPYLGVGLIRKNFVEDFGYLFDPDYFIYAEDLDLGLRIRLKGKKLLFEPRALMHHMHAVTTQKSSKAFTTYLMERNLLTTFFKILSWKNVILFLPYVMLARVLAIIKDVLTLKFNLASARLRAIFFVLLNFGLILRKRKDTQKHRKTNDGYILKIFDEKYLFKPKFTV